MARYSNAVYQGAYYGTGVSKLSNSAEPLYSVATGYTSVQLTWVEPNNAGTVFTEMRLVRNQDTYPESEEDGAIVWYWDGTGNIATSFEDGIEYTDIALASGRYVYYRMWIRDSSNLWTPAGDSFTILPKQHSTTLPDGSQTLSTHDKFMDLLPRVFTSASHSPIDEVDSSQVLYRFLSAFSLSLDEVLTLTDLILPEASGRHTNPGLVLAQADQLGITESSLLISKRQKRMVREAIYTTSRKGTLLSLGTLVESVTGFAPDITVSSNIMMTNQDSTFNKGVGFWVPVGSCVLTSDNTVYPPEAEAKAIDMNYTAKAVVSAANARITNGLDAPKTRGIPVVAGTEYTLSWYSKLATGSGAISAQVYWYDFQGVEISHTAATSASVTTSWGSRQTVTATAPTGATYAGLSLTFLNTGTYNIDLVQFANSTVTDFAEARCVDIFLNPSKSNYIENPSFYPTVVVAPTEWVFDVASSEFVTPSTVPNVYDGSHMLTVVTNTGTESSISVQSGSLPAASFYTFSIYGQATTDDEVWTMTIEATNLDGSTVYATKSKTVITTADWQRLEVNLDTSDIAEPFWITVSLSGVTTGQTVNFDAAQLEPTYSASDYFDGSVSTEDAVWESDSNSSVSYLYRNRQNKVLRLIQELQNNLPSNTPYRILMHNTDAIVGITS